MIMDDNDGTEMNFVVFCCACMSSHKDNRIEMKIANDIIYLQQMPIITMHGTQKLIQLDTTAYVGVKSKAHVGYFRPLSSQINGWSGLCKPNEIGTNDTSAANNQIVTIDKTAMRRVTHRPYLEQITIREKNMNIKNERNKTHLQ